MAKMQAACAVSGRSQNTFAASLYDSSYQPDTGRQLALRATPCSDTLLTFCGFEGIPRETIAEAVTEIVGYTERCRRAAQQLAKLAPIPLTTFSILEYGL